jgi:fatty acid kinase
MTRKELLNGQELRDMFAAATVWLEKSVPEIDALNVFPVPDGDTGTNMMLTMRSCLEEAYRAPDHSAAGVAKYMAKGALTGARGNSGVILSQYWRGVAEGLVEKDSFGASDLAAALENAAKMSRQGMTNPVEGTILTVAHDAAVAACAQAGENQDIIAIMEVTVAAAAVSVANTPNLLAVLRDAGVVDAGGQGLYTLLDGALRYLRGEMEEMQYRKPQIIASEITAAGPPPIIDDHVKEEAYGYCTNFVIKGEGLDIDDIRKKLDKKGKSLIAVGDDTQIRVHIHSLDPGSILHYVMKFGTLHQIKVDNMDDQNAEYVEMQRSKIPAGDIGIVAVVPGDGLADVFISLGANGVVSGGQTMNPSTKDLVKAVESLDTNNVIILPNNKNIVTTADQVQKLTEKKVAVVPSRTIPQGVAALLGFDYEANMDMNAEIMAEGMAQVKSVEITRAVRDTRLGEFDIKKKQPIAFLDGDLIAVGDELTEVLEEALARSGLAEASVLTVYYGKDVRLEEAEVVVNKIRGEYPALEVELVKGEQPHYHYIVSIE